MIRWRAEHPADSVPAPAVDAIVDRLVAGHHSAREIFSSLGAGAQAAAQ
jgi:hypothetical protein